MKAHVVKKTRIFYELCLNFIPVSKLSFTGPVWNLIPPKKHLICDEKFYCSSFSYLHKYFRQRSIEILLRIYTCSFPLCFHRWIFLRLNKAPDCIHLYLQVLMRDTENPLALASLFQRRHQGHCQYGFTTNYSV